MEHQLTITLPDEVFLPLVETALRQSRTPEEVVVEQVRAATPVNGARKKTGDITRFFGTWDSAESLSEEESAQAKARLKRFAGAVNSGDPHSAENERIDADLAREYADAHETED